MKIYIEIEKERENFYANITYNTILLFSISK